jgi:hypothetical protein
LHAPHLALLQDLLRRLARYGDRISIIVDERLRGLVSIDSSVFNLVLARSAACSSARAANLDRNQA